MPHRFTARALYHSAASYSSPSSSSSSDSLTASVANSFTLGDEWLPSPPTSPFLVDSEMAEDDLSTIDIACPEDFLPPPWDPIAYEQSMLKSLSPGSKRQRIPRPPNAFMLFRSFLLKYRLAQRVANHQQNASRVAGLIWRSPTLPEHIKMAWYTRADAVRDWHKEKFPEYKFSPSRRKHMRGQQDDSEDEDTHNLKHYAKSSTGASRSRLLSARKGRHLKSTKHESDSEDEYSPYRRRTPRRSSQRAVSPSPSKSRRRATMLPPFSSSHSATPALSYPTSPSSTPPRLSPVKHISKLLELQSYIANELSLAYARMPDMDTASSCMPYLLSTKPASPFSLPPMLPSTPFYAPGHRLARSAAMGEHISSVSSEVRHPTSIRDILLTSALTRRLRPISLRLQCHQITQSSSVTTRSVWEASSHRQAQLVPLATI